MENKYLVFHGSRYYPYGGWEDYKGKFETLEEATAFLVRIMTEEDTEHQWGQIVDMKDNTMKEYYYDEDNKSVGLESS